MWKRRQHTIIAAIFTTTYGGRPRVHLQLNGQKKVVYKHNKMWFHHKKTRHGWVHWNDISKGVKITEKAERWSPGPGGGEVGMPSLTAQRLSVARRRISRVLLPDNVECSILLNSTLNTAAMVSHAFFLQFKTLENYLKQNNTKPGSCLSELLTFLFYASRWSCCFFGLPHSFSYDSNIKVWVGTPTNYKLKFKTVSD